MSKLIVANWKANLSPDAGREWLQTLLAAPGTPVADVGVVLAVPFLFLREAAALVGGNPRIHLAAQGVSSHPPGAYTGATPAAWLKGLVRYALIGHRERRTYFHESTAEIAAQVRETLAADIIPILCLEDEGLAAMRAALEEDEMEAVLPAYTPEAAMALERVRSPEGIVESIGRVARYFPGRPVLYGGGVTPENGRAILALPEVSGILLGRGCLDAAKFAGLCRSA